MTRRQVKRQRLISHPGVLALGVVFLPLNAFCGSHPAIAQSADSKGAPLAAAASLAAARPQIAKIKVTISEEKVGTRTFTVATANFPVSQQRLWELLTDYGNASKIFANLAKSEVLGRKDNIVTIHQIVKPGYFPFTFDYVVDLAETPISLLEWHRVSGSFAAYEGAWKVEPIVSTASTTSTSTTSTSTTSSTSALTPATPSTRVTYRVYLDANKFIPQWLMRRSLHGYLPEVFDSLRKALNKT
jgi:ribosome-associated toxin RatA of RatAB toxin-antitoxin module